MADEPVSAWPDRPIQSLARWSRRHRPLTWAAAASLVVLAVSSTAAAIFVNGARAERGRVAQAEIDLERAEANFRLARQAVDDYLTRVSENTLLKVQPSRDLRALRKGLLEDALKFYGTFISRARGRPVPAAASWPAPMPGSARSPRRSAPRPRPSPPTQGPRDPQGLGETPTAATLALRIELAESLDAIGVLHRSLGRLPDCLASLDEARATLEPVVAARVGSVDAQFRLAQSCSHLGAVQKLREEFDAAAGLSDQARDHPRPARRARPRRAEIPPRISPGPTTRWGTCSPTRGARTSTSTRAQAFYETALDLHRKLIVAHPGEPDYPIDMAQCYVSLATLSRAKGDHPAAIRYLQDALKIQLKAVASHPSVTLYLLDLSETYYNLG